VKRPGAARRWLRWALSAALGCVLFVALMSAARAGSLTPQEKAALDRGEVVKRKLTFDLDEGRYAGGVAYVIIKAPVRVIMDALMDVGAYTSILPLTAEAKLAGMRDKDPLITVKHWTRFATASYTVRVRREGATLVRFWRDKSFPADVEDCWGYFRATRIDKDTSLFTYAAVMNLGFGIARILFESKIQDYALTTPELVRSYAERKRAGTILPGR
jgi:hypothetical protein